MSRRSISDLLTMIRFRMDSSVPPPCQQEQQVSAHVNVQQGNNMFPYQRLNSCRVFLMSDRMRAQMQDTWRVKTINSQEKATKDTYAQLIRLLRIRQRNWGNIRATSILPTDCEEVFIKKTLYLDIYNNDTQKKNILWRVAVLCWKKVKTLWNTKASSASTERKSNFHYRHRVHFNWNLTF